MVSLLSWLVPVATDGTRSFWSSCGTQVDQNLHSYCESDFTLKFIYSFALFCLQLGHHLERLQEKSQQSCGLAGWANWKTGAAEFSSQNKYRGGLEPSERAESMQKKKKNTA